MTGQRRRYGFEGLWSDFDLPDFDTEAYTGDDVVGRTSYSPVIRTADELAQAIKTAGGKLIVGQGTSALLVALNNALRFSANINSGGNYEITDRLGGNSSILLIGGAGVALVLVIALAGR